MYPSRYLFLSVLFTLTASAESLGVVNTFTLGENSQIEKLLDALPNKTIFESRNLPTSISQEPQAAKIAVSGGVESHEIDKILSAVNITLLLKGSSAPFTIFIHGNNEYVGVSASSGECVSGVRWLLFKNNEHWITLRPGSGMLCQPKDPVQ